MDWGLRSLELEELWVLVLRLGDWRLRVVAARGMRLGSFELRGLEVGYGDGTSILSAW